MPVPTKEQLLELLRTNDKALARALVVLNERQTFDEKRSEHTKYENSRGFSAAHGKRGTGMANFYLKAGFLTPKQLAWWREPKAKGGIMRIGIYARQLLEIAAEKEAKRLELEALKVKDPEQL